MTPAGGLSCHSVIVAVVAFTASLTVRLGRASLHARSLPEGLLALFFAGGVGGYKLRMLPHSFSFSGPELARIDALAQTLLILPAVTIVFFTWRVFRSQSAWAGALATTLALLTATSTLAVAWLVGPLSRELSTEPGSPFYWVTSSVRAASFAWSCLEASLYYAKARRRMAAGLIDALVGNRFLLWAIWSGAATTLAVTRTIHLLPVGTASPATAVSLPIVLLMLAAGASCVVAAWLTFAPPRFYRRLVEGGAATTA